MPDVPYPPNRPGLHLAPPSGCGHDPNERSAIIKAVKPAGDITSNTQAFILRSLTGGDQQLICSQCPQCRSHYSYLYRAESGGIPRGVGDDLDDIQCVLHAVLAQPDVDVFTLVVTGDPSLTSYVLPRHHLPAFRITSQ